MRSAIDTSFVIGGRKRLPDCVDNGTEGKRGKRFASTAPIFGVRHEG